MSIASIKAYQTFSTPPVPTRSDAPLKTTVLNEDQKARLKTVFQVRFTYNSPAGLFTGNLLSFIGTFMRSGHLQGLFLKGGVVRHVLFNVPLSGRDLDLSAAIKDLGDKQQWEGFGDSFLQHMAGQIICGNKYEIKGRGLDGKVFDEKGRSLLMQLPMEMKGIAKSIDVDFAAVGSSTPFARQHSCDSSYGCSYIDLKPALEGNWDHEFSVIAMDGYDLAASMALTEQRRFYIQAGAGKTLFQGIRKYCDHLTRGIIADSGLMNIPQTEKDFCESVLKMVESGQGLELGSYLKEHYNNDIPSQILFLINYHDIFQRSGVKDAKVEQEIYARLTKILGLKEIPKNISELLSVCKGYLYLTYSSEGHDESFAIAENRKGHFLFCEDSTGLKKKRGLVIEASLAAIRETIAHVSHEIVKDPFIVSFYGHFTQKTDLYTFCKNELGQRHAFLQRNNVSVAQLLSDLRAFIDNYSHARGIFSVEAIAGQLLLLTTREGIATPSRYRDFAPYDPQALIENIDRLFNQLMRRNKGQLAEQIFRTLLKDPTLLTAEQKQSFAKRLIGFLIKREKENGFKRALGIYGLLLNDKNPASLTDIILKALPGQKLKGFKELHELFKKPEESKEDEKGGLSWLIPQINDLTQAQLDQRGTPDALSRIMSAAAGLSKEEARSLHEVLCEQEEKLYSARSIKNVKGYLEEMHRQHLQLLLNTAQQSESGQEALSWPVVEAYKLMKSGKLPENVLVKYWDCFAPFMFSDTKRMQSLFEIFSVMPSQTKNKFINVILQKFNKNVQMGDLAGIYSLCAFMVEVVLDESFSNKSRLNLLIQFFTISPEIFDDVCARMPHKKKMDFRKVVVAFQKLSRGTDQDLDASIEKYPFFQFWAQILLGNAAYKQSGWKLAIEHYSKAVKNIPPSNRFDVEMDVRERIVIAYHNLKDKEHTLLEIQKACENLLSYKFDDLQWKEKLSGLFFRFGKILADNGAYDKELELYHQALILDPKDYHIFKVMAEVCYAKGDAAQGRVFEELYIQNGKK